MYYSLDAYERKFATLLVLSKMLDTEISDGGQFTFLSKGALHKINNRIALDDIYHEIEGGLFFEIITELQSDNIISTLNFYSYCIKDRNKLNQKIAELNSVGITLDKMRNYYNGDDFAENEKELRSIHLVTESVAVKEVIFLVFDERYEMPFRSKAKNHKGGDTYTKKLHDIAYLVDAPGKKVDYNKLLADNINNGLFGRRPIARYMKTNKFKKPTLVQKSEDGKTLVLKGELFIKTILISDVPTQYQYLYRSKIK
jgi:hypothetical protein